MKVACQHESFDFAIKLIESQYTEINARYDTLNQKLGTYTATLAIIVSVLVLFLQSIFSRDVNVLGHFSRISHAPFLLTFFFFLMLASLLFSLVSIVFTLVRVFQGLIPLKLQQVDLESFDLAMQDKVASAKKKYARDLEAATKWNKEAIQNRFSILYSINRWFLVIVISLVVLISSNAMFLILN